MKTPKKKRIVRRQSKRCHDDYDPKVEENPYRDWTRKLPCEEEEEADDPDLLTDPSPPEDKESHGRHARHLEKEVLLPLLRLLFLCGDWIF